MNTPNPARKSHSIDLARHSHVTEHQINFRMRLDQPHRGECVLGLQNGVAGVLQQFGRNLTHRLIVVDEKDGRSSRM